MALVGWLRALDAVGGLAAVAQRMLAPREEKNRPASDPLSESLAVAGQPGELGQLEARLAGVVVAALKEAFDRDRARLDVERHHLDEERARAERALRLEQVRQAGDRALGELRLVALLSLGVWAISAVLVAWPVDVSAPPAKVLLAIGWSGLIGALAGASVAHRRVLAWLSESEPSGDPPAAIAASWLLAAGLAFTAASVIVAL